MTINKSPISFVIKILFILIANFVIPDFIIKTHAQNCDVSQWGPPGLTQYPYWELYNAWEPSQSHGRVDIDGALTTTDCRGLRARVGSEHRYDPKGNTTIIKESFRIDTYKFTVTNNSSLCSWNDYRDTYWRFSAYGGHGGYSDFHYTTHDIDGCDDAAIGIYRGNYDPANPTKNLVALSALNNNFGWGGPANAALVLPMLSGEYTLLVSSYCETSRCKHDIPIANANTAYKIVVQYPQLEHPVFTPYQSCDYPSWECSSIVNDADPVMQWREQPRDCSGFSMEVNYDVVAIKIKKTDRYTIEVHSDLKRSPFVSIYMRVFDPVNPCKYQVSNMSDTYNTMSNTTYFSSLRLDPDTYYLVIHSTEVKELREYSIRISNESQSQPQILSSCPPEPWQNNGSGQDALVMVPGFQGANINPVGSGGPRSVRGVFQGMISDLQGYGYSKPIYVVGTYWDDIDTDANIATYGGEPNELDPNDHQDPETGNGLHGGSSIRHMAYHLGHYLASYHGKVDVIAHSMGGVMVRSALLESELETDPSIPKLAVTRIITHGSPHGGLSKKGLSALSCTVLNFEDRKQRHQCRDLKAGSEFMERLRIVGQHPNGLGGTKWTVTGANTMFFRPWSPAPNLHLLKVEVMKDDDVVGSLTATAMAAEEKIIWEPMWSIDQNLMPHPIREVTHNGRPSVMWWARYYYGDPGVEPTSVLTTLDGENAMFYKVHRAAWKSLNR